MTWGIPDAIAAAAIGVAVVTDLQAGRIPNWLTLPLWLVGVVWWLIAGPWWFGIAGLVLAFVIHYALWAVNVDRGGDAKLMIGIGALVGWRELVEITVWHVLLMGPVALIYMTITGKLGNFVAHVKYLGKRLLGRDPGEKPESTYIAKAPVIALAFLVGRLTDVLVLVLLGAPQP